MIDLHCHLLPGVDDGPPTMEAALDEARAHLYAGTEHVVCTPHVTHGHRNTAALIAEGVAALREALAAAALPLTVSTGAEVSIARAIELPDEELAALRLAGGPWLLLEPPLSGEVPRLPELIQGLRARGHAPLIAHPERCAVFHRDPSVLEVLVKQGAAAQVTAGSLTGQFGRTVQKLARSMVDAGLIHVVASDAHDAVHRPPGLRLPVVEAGYDPAFADWACTDVPAAIVHGTELPPRPAHVGGGGGRRRLFGRR